MLMTIPMTMTMEMLMVLISCFLRAGALYLSGYTAAELWGYCLGLFMPSMVLLLRKLKAFKAVGTLWTGAVQYWLLDFW